MQAARVSCAMISAVAVQGPQSMYLRAVSFYNNNWLTRRIGSQSVARTGREFFREPVRVSVVHLHRD